MGNNNFSEEIYQMGAVVCARAGGDTSVIRHFLSLALYGPEPPVPVPPCAHLRRRRPTFQGAVRIGSDLIFIYNISRGPGIPTAGKYTAHIYINGPFRFRGNP